MAKKTNPLQPRLQPDVAALVVKHAKANSRTIPQEVNHVLRLNYTAKRITLGSIRSPHA